MINKELVELQHMEKWNPDDLFCKLESNQKLINMDYNIYYDTKEDELWMNHYYKNISTESTNLFQKYHRLITNTHQNMHPYYISKDHFLYTWVDLHPNGQLISIYSGKQINPQRLIEEDFATILKRFANYKEHLKIQDYSEERLIEQLRKISSQHKFNTEHVVPQSWFQAKEPMKGDLHHLFVCEPICNNLRSNFPYFEYDLNKVPIHARGDCGKQDFNGFEPAYGKGIVARATLYFLLRYPKELPRKILKDINLPLLFSWHKQYGVTDYEKHRNKAIFEIQGNRNPFIDNPDLVEKISFPI